MQLNRRGKKKRYTRVRQRFKKRRPTRSRNKEERFLGFPTCVWQENWKLEEKVRRKNDEGRLQDEHVRREALSTVTVVGSHVKSRFLTNLHLEDSFVPSLDHHSKSNLLPRGEDGRKGVISEIRNFQKAKKFVDPAGRTWKENGSLVSRVDQNFLRGCPGSSSMPVQWTVTV